MICEDLSCTAHTGPKDFVSLFHRLDFKPQSAVIVLLSEDKQNCLVTLDKFQTEFGTV